MTTSIDEECCPVKWLRQAADFMLQIRCTSLILVFNFFCCFLKKEFSCYYHLCWICFLTHTFAFNSLVAEYLLRKSNLRAFGRAYSAQSHFSYKVMFMTQAMEGYDETMAMIHVRWLRGNRSKVKQSSLLILQIQEKMTFFLL